MKVAKTATLPRPAIGAERPKLLLVEDDCAVRSSISRRPSYEGFDVATSADGAEGLTVFERFKPDLVLLDVMLPGLDGLQVTERLRSKSGVPILLLSAKDTLEDRVQGLTMGADDYVVKPFELVELLARIRALLRRVGVSTEAASPNQSSTKTLEFAGLRLDPETREVSRDDSKLELTPKEFSLLEFFLKHPGRVLTREQIIEAVWGYDEGGNSNSLDVYMRYLRVKLEAECKRRLFHTVRGVGYVLRD